jgi:hypothetical protein
MTNAPTHPPRGSGNLPIDVATETLLSFSQAARRFPPFREGRGVSPSTIWRWHRTGVRLADGRRVRLDAIRCGGRWLTSVEAVQRFIEAQTPDDPEPPAGVAVPLSPTPRPPTRRERAADRAGRELSRLGI